MNDVTPRATSGHATAKLALTLLDPFGYLVPTVNARRNIAMAFAAEGYVVYGKAFDCLRCAGGPLDLEDLDAVRQRFRDITLYEVKSTSKKVRPDFGGYFFSLSTAELLVAQSLGPQFRFLFVNTSDSSFMVLTLQEVYARAKAIYPSWSIQF